MAKEFGDPIELTVGEHVVRVSNPSKPYFPEVGITKLEVVQHYLACGDGIMRAPVSYTHLTLPTNREV